MNLISYLLILAPALFELQVLQVARKKSSGTKFRGKSWGFEDLK